MADPAAFLPYGRQSIDEDDIAAVAQALRADFLTTGPTVEAFEAAFAHVVGARHAVACINGTAALHLTMLALGVGPGDVCIVPSITFLATANCAAYVGAEVVFADVDPQSGLMTPDTLAEALERAGGKARVVLPVHLRGEVRDLAALKAVAGEAVFVEDAAHALGSPGVGKGAMATWSFHPVKTITTGEGGMVTTDDTDLAARLRLFRNHGMVRTGPWSYEMAQPGFNYRLPDILCALGLSQLKKLPDFAAKRRALAARYAERLPPHIRPAGSMAGDPVLHLMTVLADFSGRREQVMQALAEKGIGTQLHYIPVHTQPYWNTGLSLPGAQAWYARCLSLPLHPSMTEADVDRVAEALTEVL